MNIINPYRFAAAGFAPTDITGCDLWLDASDNSTVLDATDTAASDDEAVKTWQDKSGNANHAAQSTAANQPLRRAAEVNGLDALDFDGANDYMVGTSDLTPRQTDAKTIFVVCKLDTLAVTHITYTPYNSTSTNGTRGSLAYNSTVGLNYAVLGGFEASTDETVGTASAYIHTYSQSGSGNLHDVMTQWQDGSELTRTSGGDQLLVDKSCTYDVGAWNNGDFTNGKMCEIIVYDSELSTANRESVESYLGSKWGVTII